MKCKNCGVVKNFITLFSAPRDQSDRAVFSIIPPPAIFVKQNFPEKCTNFDPEIYAFFY
jgi:hypothetical protein